MSFKCQKKKQKTEVNVNLLKTVKKRKTRLGMIRTRPALKSLRRSVAGSCRSLSRETVAGAATAIIAPAHTCPSARYQRSHAERGKERERETSDLSAPRSLQAAGNYSALSPLLNRCSDGRGILTEGERERGRESVCSRDAERNRRREKTGKKKKNE